ncbi:hypothetical protein GCM10011348_21220 [Marinobacterium nitratireducens]|uniref:DUF2252 domain-containing protein n=1 Tax=Marinobacterium nitratireducens TaxID=518897 RepID=A0A917ZDY3_9GAMM|nr:DUF2252 family protein [Marinobacterium nitratireducens]GGO81678.1 hypothetical protein GCM10011348_21220 [Marinobacterium nitratireducens]
MTTTAHNRSESMLAELDTTNAGLTPELRAQKYHRMAVSPFTFYRGSNHLYWSDLYRDWHFSLFGGLSETQTWLQGDAHLHNFGAYGSHDNQVRFGLDDFDDALIGDYQYDLWRLAVSLVLAMREMPDCGDKAIRKALRELARSYLEGLANWRTLIDWVAMPDSSDGRLQKFLVRTAARKSRQAMLDKWTCGNDDERRFQAGHAKLGELPQVQRGSLIDALEAYQDSLDDEVPGHSQQHFRVKDVARRLAAGTGSLGSDRFYALIEGQAEGDHDDVILDIKAQQPPAAWQVMNRREREEYSRLFGHEGERHARAFQALARHPDPYVGWLELDGQWFSVRERSPFKADYPTHKLTKGKAWRELAQNWGAILAASHLRGARALGSGREAIFADAVSAPALGRFDAFIDLLGSMAFAYADCVVGDHRQFCIAHRLVDG